MWCQGSVTTKVNIGDLIHHPPTGFCSQSEQKNRQFISRTCSCRRWSNTLLLCGKQRSADWFVATWCYVYGALICITVANTGDSEASSTKDGSPSLGLVSHHSPSKSLNSSDSTFHSYLLFEYFQALFHPQTKESDSLSLKLSGRDSFRGAGLRGPIWKVMINPISYIPLIQFGRKLAHPPWDHSAKRGNTEYTQA